jgi:hypothetical protein
MNFRNKLERLLLASLSNQAYCLRARPGAHNRVEHLKGVSGGLMPYPRTLNYPGKACEGPTLELNMKFRTLQP